MRVVKILGEHGNYTVLFEDEPWQQSSRLQYQLEVERSARSTGLSRYLNLRLARVLEPSYIAEARRSLGLGPSLCAKGFSNSAGRAPVPRSGSVHQRPGGGQSAASDSSCFT